MQNIFHGKTTKCRFAHIIAILAGIMLAFSGNALAQQQQAKPANAATPAKSPATANAAGAKPPAAANAALMAPFFLPASLYYKLLHKRNVVGKINKALNPVLNYSYFNYSLNALYIVNRALINFAVRINNRIS